MMKEKEILESLLTLGQQQGYYQRVYNNLIDLKENDINSYSDFIETLENANFTDIIDLIMFIES